MSDTTAGALPLDEPGREVTPRKLIAFSALVFGMFMAILDIQIVSSSLSEIQAGLSAAPDEISWVQTSYLIAEVVMIPLSGFLARALSTRILFTLSALGFTIASVLCATATTLPEMVVYRAIQGFVGGGMIPTAFAAAYTIFPRRHLAPIMAVVGLTVTLAPTIGPTVGGYLTSAFSWHWLFLVNVIPGLAATVLAWTLVDFDEPEFSLLKRFDVWGLLAMAVSLGSLQYFLEEGTREDWFNSGIITFFFVLTIAGGAIFFWRTLRAEVPVVDLSAFRNRNFAVGCTLTFIIGIGLYGLTYLYPLYLAWVRGYNSLQIGETVFVTGAFMFMSAPMIGMLSRKYDPRIFIGLGLIGFVISTFELTPITSQWGFSELFFPQALRGMALMFCMAPINMLALGTLPPEQVKNASGLFNLMRNVGGAVGLAIINTMLTTRMDVHKAQLREHIIWGRNVAEETLQGMTQKLAPVLGSDAEAAALKKLAGIVQREATVLAFADVFLLLSIFFCVACLFVPLLEKPKMDASAAAH
ncbi:MAG TPA: DHA2 family efflux MFS transporter permease subunit [Xanthobacteraceae bacterium]|nr:DHA2 family efflux MFS transporter permease subunit [Xanthobacteraceae bacterium]